MLKEMLKEKKKEKKLKKKEKKKDKKKKVKKVPPRHENSWRNPEPEALNISQPSHSRLQK